MTGWQEISVPPIPADVVRWIEPVFYYSKRKKARPVKTGSREVTAEVLKIEGEWIFLLVRGCKKITADTLKDIEIFKPGKEIKRKTATLLRNNPERLIWSDETAREAILGG